MAKWHRRRSGSKSSIMDYPPIRRKQPRRQRRWSWHWAKWDPQSWDGAERHPTTSSWATTGVEDGHRGFADGESDGKSVEEWADLRGLQGGVRGRWGSERVAVSTFLSLRLRRPLAETPQNLSRLSSWDWWIRRFCQCYFWGWSLWELWGICEQFIAQAVESDSFFLAISCFYRLLDAKELGFSASKYAWSWRYINSFTSHLY